MFPELAQKEIPALRKLDDSVARKILGEVALGVSIYRATLARSAHLLQDVIRAVHDGDEAQRLAALQDLQGLMGSIGGIGEKLAGSLMAYDALAPYFGAETWGALMLSPRHRALRDALLKDGAHQLHAEVTEGGGLRQLSDLAKRLAAEGD